MDDVRDITGAWDYATLPANIRIGADCIIERKESFSRCRSARQPAIVLGDRVTVYTWTTFNLEPSGRVVVGDDSMLIGAILMCADRITIGKRVIISYHVTIADSDFHPRDPALRKHDAIANAPQGDKRLRPPLVTRPVVIEDDVWIGIGAIVLKGVRIGRGARIGAGAVVATDVPTGAVIVGNPAKEVTTTVPAP